MVNFCPKSKFFEKCETFEFERNERPVCLKEAALPAD
jgi:hypothetical protein